MARLRLLRRYRSAHDSQPITEIDRYRRQKRIYSMNSNEPSVHSRADLAVSPLGIAILFAGSRFLERGYRSSVGGIPFLLGEESHCSKVVDCFLARVLVFQSLDLLFVLNWLLRVVDGDGYYCCCQPAVVHRS